jgi:hypothetical protein
MSSVSDIMESYYTPEIQLNKNIIEDILKDIIVTYKQKTNLLVFGTGNDTLLWKNANIYGHTLFVEHDFSWFEKISIDFPEDIMYHKYSNISVKSSKSMTLEDLKKFIVPFQLREYVWDIIIIDGPTGYDDSCPGRALPIYWSTLIRHGDTIVYIDDCNREVEKLFIDLCFDKSYSKKYYGERHGTMRISQVP